MLLVSRLCHVGILWEGDTLPLAAAAQMAAGKVLYRDIWFDKPPLTAAFYLFCGGQAGGGLRVIGAFYALLASALAYGFARRLWSEREGWWAAGLLAFSLMFDLPSAVIPVASDLLMLAPHLAAVWMAYERRPFWSGVLAGIAFWINPKGVLVGLAGVVWYPAGVLWMAAGFSAVSAAGAGWLWGYGALGSYWEEVWRWGRLYAGSTFLEAPFRIGLVRTLNWTGFHAGLVAASAIALARERKHAWIAWLALSILGVAMGLRFFPRYYFQVLPVATMLAARGFSQVSRRHLYPLLLLLAIPLVRFAPSYWAALTEPGWRDIRMDQESRAAAAAIRQRAKSGDTLFVWGYRPEIYIYSGLSAATKFLDSQPLTGVPADRHLTISEAVETEGPRQRRVELSHSQPTFVVDGLAPYNPRLSIRNYPELSNWLADYREVARAGQAVIYRRHPLLALPAGGALAEKR